MKKAIKSMIVIPLIFLATDVLLGLIPNPALRMDTSSGFLYFLAYGNSFTKFITHLNVWRVALATGAAVWFTTKKQNIDIKEKLKRNIDKKQLAICFAMGFSFAVILKFFSNFLMISNPLSVNLQNLPYSFGIAFLIGCIVILVCEEIAYRVCMISIGEKYISKNKAMVMAAVLAGVLNSGIVFGLLRPYILILAFISAAFFVTFGLLTGYIYINTDNFYCSLSASIGAGLSIICLTQVAKSENLFDIFYMTDFYVYGTNYILRTYVLLGAAIAFAVCVYWFKRLYLDNKKTKSEN